MTGAPPTSDLIILRRAARALGKVEAFGGVTRLTFDDVEAMAIALLILGLVILPPHHPEPLLLVNRKENRDDRA